MKTKLLLMLTLLLTVVGGVKAQLTPINPGGGGFYPGGGSSEPTGVWSDESNRDTDWGSDYATATEFTITTPQQLAQFAYLVNNGSDFSGKTVTLDNGVEEIEWQGQIYTETVYFSGDLNNIEWTPIGTAEHPFCGTFDGNGKSITYLTITGENSYQGLFGYIGVGGVVKDLVLEYGCSVSGSTQVGTLAGYNAGTVQNCVVLNATISGTGFVGSIIGQNAGTATECYSIGSTTLALGADGSTTGEDSDGHAQCLYYFKPDGETITSINDYTVSVVGTPTGKEVGDYKFYNDGVQSYSYHYYKTGSTPNLTYNKAGYDVTFSVSGATIDGNVVTVGTSDITVSLASKEVAEWSGSGNSADDPYLINIREQFDMLAERVNAGNTYAGKFFRLEDDIRSYGSDQTPSYTPIGTADHPFCGTFDGNGKEIKYVGSIDGERSYQGIFGHIGQGGVVKNLQTTSCAFRGYDYIGVIAGYNAGTIQNCRVKYSNNYGGNVTFTADGHSCYGTIAGFNSGTVSECVSYGVVEPSNGVSEYTNVTKCGGIVGHNTGTVQNCLFLGSNVIGTAYVGAIVGHNEGILTNNYYHDNGGEANGNIAAGTVKGVGASGTITGSDNENAILAKVVKLPDGGTGRVPYGAELVGTPSLVTTSNPDELAFNVYPNGILFDDGYLDDIYNHDEMRNAFYTIPTTIELAPTQVPTGYVASFSTESTGASFSGNMLTVGADADVIEITVSAQRVPEASSWLAYRASEFSTTGANTITITSAEELGLLAYNVNFGGQTYEGYTITIGATNIDLSEHDWEPICYGLQSAMYGYGGFLGTFDGAAKPISGLKVNSSMGAGLFSVVPSGATVKNVILQSPQVQGEMYVGAIAGMCSGTIQNCHVSYGTIEAPSESEMVAYFGGIAGMCADGTIAGCTFMGGNIYPVMSSAQGIGGIVGGIAFRGNGATVKDNLFTGNITKVDGNMGVGAIAGMDESYGGDYVNTITNNYYIDGTNPHATLNTELLGIGGADTEGAATQAYAYSSEPDDFGDATTDYGYGMKAYSAGIHYNLMYYSPTEPTTMAITLSNTEDNSSLLSTYNGKTGTVTLGGRRFYKDGDWNTICLPFTIDNINAEGCPLAGDGVELWQLTANKQEFNAETGELTLEFENCYSEGETSIIAGQPYLIKWAKPADYEGKEAEYDLTEEDLVFENVTISKTEPIGDNAGSEFITFVGTFSGTTFESENRSVLMLGGGNTLYYPAQGAFIGACRAYFQLNGITAGDPVSNEQPVKAFVLNFGDNLTTGVMSMDKGAVTKDSEAGAWYDLSGRKVQKGQNGQLPRGIYVNNGRKVVIK